MNRPRFLGPIVVCVFFGFAILPILSIVVSPLFSGSLKEFLSCLKLFNKEHIKLAGNTLAIGLGTTFFSVLIGTVLAVLIGRTDIPGKNFLKVSYLVPLLIPPYIQVIVWIHISAFLKKFLSFNIYGLWGTICVLTLSYFPFAVLLLLAGLKSIDRNMEEASLFFTDKWNTFRHITLPLITPYIFCSAIFIFIFSTINFAVPEMLRVKVYTVEIFVQFGAFYNERGAALLSLPLICITGLLIMLQRKLMENRFYVQIGGGQSLPMYLNLGRIKFVAFGFCLLVFGLSVGMPIGVLFKVAGSLSNYIAAVETSIGQVGYSISLAAGGAFLAVCLGFFLSYMLERIRAKKYNLLEFLCFIPLAIPSVTYGIGLIKTWNQPVAEILYSTSWIIIIGYVARFIPFSTITIKAGFKHFNPSLEEVALLNCSRWDQIVRKIITPLLSPALIVAFFIVFVLALGELGTTLLIIPPGRETIPIRIYNLMHYGADHMVAALSLIIVASILAFLGIILIFYIKLIRRASI